MQPLATQNLVTVSGFKSRNPDIDLSAWTDDTVSGMISRATRAIQNYCEVDAFWQTSVSGETAPAVMGPDGDLVIYPRVRPISQSGILSVKLQKAGFSTTLTLSGETALGWVYYYQVPYPYTSLVYPSSYLAGTGTLMIGGSSQLVTLKGAGVFYDIDYIGGYETIPEDLMDACDLYVRDYAIRRLNPMGAQTVRQGSFEMSRTIRTAAGSKNDIADSIWIMQAQEILNNGGYRRVVLG